VLNNFIYSRKGTPLRGNFSFHSHFEFLPSCSQWRSSYC